MKILSCFIAGFGKFTSQNFEFSSSLTVIKEDNGWGKTTLADFLKCMLFGMDNGRNRALSSNDRAKYEPWRGGAYGGYLIFSVGEKTYRVERSFGKTAAMDTTRIYDSNNMLCYDFGEKGERLGESIFGVNAESFKRSVYIPQGEIQTGGMPEDMKNRLLALLNTGGQSENGAARALEKLDEADRLLRSRRRPLKGKLDEIDEKIEILTRKQWEKESNIEKARLLRSQAVQAEQELLVCGKRIEETDKKIEDFSRQKEKEARRETARGAQEELNRINGELGETTAFFKGVDPSTVNVDGLQKAVTEFYALKEQQVKLEEDISSISPIAQERSGVVTQLQTIGKTLESYHSVIEETAKRQGAGTSRRKGRKIIPPKRKSNTWILLAGLLLAFAGCILTVELMAAGLALLGIGLFGMAFVALRAMPRYEKRENTATQEQQPDEQLVKEYTTLCDEYNRLKEELKKYPPDAESRKEKLLLEREGIVNRMRGIEQGICNFLGNFAFVEQYDYRACVSILREKMALHKRLTEEKLERESKISSFTDKETEVSVVYSSTDLEIIRREKSGAEERKEQLLSLRAQALSQAERLEMEVAGDFIGERERLLEEKSRLELRHKAILLAKDFLLRAKENMASRYLDPVESSCKRYLAQFDLKEGGMVRFTASGEPICEEYGKMRELEYYSTGLKELIGLCTRVALVDAVFKKETPVLIMDDPLTDLDDYKTAKAKAWIKSLSARYQIIYLTCKNERKI